MEQIIALFTNRFFVVPLASWGIAQILKVIINYCITKELNWERLFGDGGMPSGHSATVSSLAVFTALNYGTASFQFAVCFILSIIVCHDAMGVRQETIVHSNTGISGGRLGRHSRQCHDRAGR